MRLPSSTRLVVLACASSAALVGCKPSDEPARRATIVLGSIDGPDVGAPPPSVPGPAAPGTMDGAKATRVDGRNAPPVVGEVARGPATQAFEAVEERDGADAGTSPEGGADATAAGPGDVGGPLTEEIVEAADSAAPEPIASPLPRYDEPMEDEVAAALAKPPGQVAQDEARALNKSGLEKLKQKLYDEAIATYRQALEAWPGHVYSRFNLACALTLTGRTDEALGALQILWRMAATSTGAADRLKAARIDKDFEPLRKDPRFRTLTGATDIVVAWSRDGDKTEAKRLAEVLRTAKWAAKSSGRAWNASEAMPREPTVLYREDDAVAARSAAEVAAALGVDGIRAEPAGPLPPEAPPIVVWLGGGAEPPDGDAPPDDGPPSHEPPSHEPGDAPPSHEPGAEAPGERGEVADFIGVRVFAGSGGDRASFELQPSGFFLWDELRDGAHTKRSGRYQVRGTKLALTFEERVETGVTGGAPKVEVRAGQSLIVSVAVREPGVLSIDGRAFRPRAAP